MATSCASRHAAGAAPPGIVATIWLVSLFAWVVFGGLALIDVSVVLALAEVLYGRSPEAYALTVCGESFEGGEGLTATVAALS